MGTDGRIPGKGGDDDDDDGEDEDEEDEEDEEDNEKQRVDVNSSLGSSGERAHRELLMIKKNVREDNHIDIWWGVERGTGGSGTDSMKRSSPRAAAAVGSPAASRPQPSALPSSSRSGIASHPNVFTNSIHGISILLIHAIV